MWILIHINILSLNHITVFVPYLPYYLIGLIFLQTAFGLIELSHPDNSIPVNRFVTPLHIVPEWYFLAYYAVLKVIPSKTGGLLVFMFNMSMKYQNDETYLVNITT
ncbi:hypothetical protein BESB_051240 [Besnoitia besnoiti]|uniref:Cytochrome b/b6 C-terminal region profile domain-containing protein n=1 Tax=Besnoitia besnoiti TaxID=94643 RepID=A0A2A9LYS4_BESBE|nr:uncharacterized protein BESB_051240 [Besnoitia besnoiti]PFH30955.1 hypothetical protein BESB_051240 [Besnoitia besnoiti]